MRKLPFSVFLKLHGFSSLFLFARLLHSWFLKGYFLSLCESVVIPNPQLHGTPVKKS